MKLVAAGFTTALLVFAAASAMSEMLLTADAMQSGDPATRRRFIGTKTARVSARSLRGISKTQNSDTAEGYSGPSVEMQRTLSDIRQRESGIQAKQDALRIVFDELREEQQSLDLLRVQVSDEIAALREATVRVSQRETRIPENVSASASTSRSENSSANARPIVAIRDRQAVRDTAVLVNRLAQQGNVREATALLRSLQERDAAKVLSELSATDSKMALRLSQDLLAARDGAASRR